MQAAPRAASGSRASSAGVKVSLTHQQGGWGSPVARSISIAQRLLPPHSGQRSGSIGGGGCVGMAGEGRVLCYGRRVIRFAIVAAALAATAAQAQIPRPTPVRVPDTLAARVQACTACHGEQGRATPDGYYPRIAGKPAAYLHNQLRHFQAGRRQAVGMTSLLDHLDDAYLGDIAAHFADLHLPYPPPAPAQGTPEQRARGERLVRVGDASRNLPSCTSCHGERMTGVQPAIPGLLGLPRDYLIGQLGAWQTGMRRATAPDCMAAIAQRLNGDDVSAVASWLAAQPLGADARPLDRLPAPLPLRCGSDLGGVR